MPKFCSESCHAICDFCQHYKDNGIEEFEGEGICLANGKETEADCGYGCDNFECFNLKG